MAREPSPTEYALTIDDIGTFIFARRNMRTQVAIEVEYSRLTEGVETLTDFAARLCAAMADLKVVTVEAPAGWDVEALDPGEPSDYAKLMKVWGALRDKEAAFRSGGKGASQGQGPGDGGDGGAGVPAPVSPAAE